MVKKPVGINFFSLRYNLLVIFKFKQKENFPCSFHHDKYSIKKLFCYLRGGSCTAADDVGGSASLVQGN